MNEIKLVKPSAEYSEGIMDFRRELIAANDKDSFAGCCGLEDFDTAEEWLQKLEKRSSAESSPGKVPSNVYLAVRCSDNRIVGVIDLRHHIDHPVLGLWGGHIGYSVRPSERGKGYAKKMLRLNLQNCRERNVLQLLVTCNENNPASEKVIIANGGVFERTVCVDGENIKRYWIEL